MEALLKGPILVNNSLLKLVGLWLVVCAPLADYFGHAIAFIFAVLGIFILATAAFPRRAALNFSKLAKSEIFVIASVFFTFGLWILSSVLGISFSKSITTTMNVILVISGLSVFAWLARKVKATDHLLVMRGIVWITVFLAVMVFFERFFPQISLLLHGTTEMARLNFSAPILVWGIPFIMVALLKDTRYILLLAFVFCAIFISNGRTGWVVAPVVVGLFLFLSGKSVSAKLWLWLGLCVALTAVFGMGMLILQQGWWFISYRVLDIAEGGSGRTDIWWFALNQWWENDRWFGIGVQGFRYLDFSGVTLNSQSHPHNSLIQLLLETGVLGLVSAITALMGVVYLAWQRMKAFKQERVVLLSCFAGTCACSLFSTSIFHAWWVLFMLMPLAWMMGWPLENKGK